MLSVYLSSLGHLSDKTKAFKEYALSLWEDYDGGFDLSRKKYFKFCFLSRKQRSIRQLTIHAPEGLRISPDYYNRLMTLSQKFKDTFGIEDITEYLDLLWYELKEGLDFNELARWDALLKGLNTISLEDYLFRYGQSPSQLRGEKVGAYLKSWTFDTEGAKKVIDLFVCKFKDERYMSIKDKRIMPEDPDAFLKQYYRLKEEFSSLLTERKNTLGELDLEVIRTYGLEGIEPEDLVMPLIR